MVMKLQVMMMAVELSSSNINVTVGTQVNITLL